MDKLGAVNLILDELGTHQVSSVDNAHPDVKTALLHISVETKTLLTRGFWFNTMKAVQVPSQSNGFVILAVNVLAATPTDTAIRAQYIQRERYMWDIQKDTRIIEGGLCLDQFIELDFDAMPINARVAVANNAASAVVRAKLSDTIKADQLERKALTYAANLDADELRMTTPNMFQPVRIAVKMARFRRRH